MLEKKLNEFGQKAYQRGDDKEDRSLPYRNWLRTVKTGGWFMDIDFIKFKIINNEPTPVAITELTRCDYETITEGYLHAIIKRYFYRDKQGQVIEKLAELLGVPAYLVLFQKDMKWLRVFDFKDKQWREYTPIDWAAFVETL